MLPCSPDPSISPHNALSMRWKIRTSSVCGREPTRRINSDTIDKGVKPILDLYTRGRSLHALRSNVGSVCTAERVRFCRSEVPVPTDKLLLLAAMVSWCGG